MTTEEQEFVREREAMLGDLLEYIESYDGPPLYQDAVVSEFRGRFPERMVVSAVWRLLDLHRIDLDNKLAIVVPTAS